MNKPLIMVFIVAVILACAVVIATAYKQELTQAKMQAQDKINAVVHGKEDNAKEAPSEQEVANRVVLGIIEEVKNNGTCKVKIKNNSVICEVSNFEKFKEEHFAGDQIYVRVYERTDAVKGTIIEATYKIEG